MKKLLLPVFAVVCCFLAVTLFSCNQNTGNAKSATTTDSVAVNKNENTAQEDSDLHEVMELPLKR